MSKLKLVLLQIVILHTLDGAAVRVDATRIEVFRPHGQCAAGANAAVAVGANKLCVKETPEKICEIIKQFKQCVD